MRYEIQLSAEARAHLKRLHQFLLDHARTREDIEAAYRAIDAIAEAFAARLTTNPFVCRKALGGRRRELVIPFGRTGYVALFDVLPGREAGAATVLVIAVRHQREEDYH